MESMPRNVSRRIMDRCAHESAIVVVVRGRKPSRVFGLNEYLKMREHPGKVKPWRHRRQSRGGGVDPLGAKSGRIVSSLRRQDIYD